METNDLQIELDDICEQYLKSDDAIFSVEDKSRIQEIISLMSSRKYVSK